MQEYTKEQQEDIKNRVEAAARYLQDNELDIAVYIQKVNTGNDIFADHVRPFIRDTRYSPKEKSEQILKEE